MKLEAPAQDAPDAYACALEAALPHLTKKLCSLWSSVEFEPFIHSILMDSRDGERKGLPWDAAQELLFLNEISVAKRAMHAAEITGMPYRQVFKNMMANVDLANTENNQSWTNPTLSNDSSHTKEQHRGDTSHTNRAKITATTAQSLDTSRPRIKPKPKSLWKRLFG